MTSSNPFRNAIHGVPVAALSLLLLTAGMCQRADEASPDEVVGPAETASVAEPEVDQEAAARAAAERQRQEALAAAERELAEREARLAEEEARLARERQLEAERQQLAAERAAAAERERQLAEREERLRQQEAELAALQTEPDDTVPVDTGPADPEPVVAEQPAPEPLPEPTGTYEGNYDEPWRESSEQETGETVSGEPVLTEEPSAPAATASLAAGQRLEVQIVSTLSSGTARTGDRFEARLVEDLRDASGTLVVPAGAEVRGRVTEASPYRRGGGPATLAVEFNEIAVSSTQTVGIRASFAELGGDRRKNRKKVVAGAVVGAILGHILGGDGSKNVIIGAAAGAAAGGAVVASAKDRDAEIPAGQIIGLQLEEVVTVEVEYGATRPG